MFPKARNRVAAATDGVWSKSLIGLMFFVFLVSPAAWATSDFEDFIEAGGDWLLDRQLPGGGFPFSEGSPTYFPSVQAPSGLAMLAAYQVTDRTDFRDAALVAADRLLADIDLFGSGDPRVRSFDPLFFVRLSDATGDTQYADFIADNFWDRLAAGTYGPDGDWDMTDYVASELVRRGAQASGPIVAAWDLALVTVAANEAGVTQFNAELMAGIRQALESATDDPADYVLGVRGFDVLGLASAVWAAAVTGLPAVPDSGAWSGLADNTAMADLLLSFQGSGPGSADFAFLQSSAAGNSPVDPLDTVSQQTVYAIQALQAFDVSAYGAAADAALSSLFRFQEADGLINYFHPEFVPDPTLDKPTVLSHAYALLTQPSDIPPPRPTVAVNTLSPWALVLLMLMMASLGWVGLAARK